MGATLTDLFTLLRLTQQSSGDDSVSDESDLWSDGKGKTDEGWGYVLPADAESITFRSAAWERKSLFDARRGSIGLAWSIFKIRGTPNAQNWPVSSSRYPLYFAINTILTGLQHASRCR